jgi:hypothetical protein
MEDRHSSRMKLPGGCMHANSKQNTLNDLSQIKLTKLFLAAIVTVGVGAGSAQAQTKRHPAAFEEQTETKNSATLELDIEKPRVIAPFGYIVQVNIGVPQEFLTSFGTSIGIDYNYWLRLTAGVHKGITTFTQNVGFDLFPSKAHHFKPIIGLSRNWVDTCKSPSSSSALSDTNAPDVCTSGKSWAVHSGVLIVEDNALELSLATFYTPSEKRIVPSFDLGVRF